jgi:hypothetical protein
MKKTKKSLMGDGLQRTLNTRQSVFSSTKNVLFQKKISRYIKLAIHVCSTKCR